MNPKNSSRDLSGASYAYEVKIDGVKGFSKYESPEEIALHTKYADLLDRDSQRYEKLARQLLKDSELWIYQGERVSRFILEDKGISFYFSTDKGSNFARLSWSKLSRRPQERKVQLIHDLAWSEARLAADLQSE